MSSLHQSQRRVHLDFHTSPFIDDVASEFDADDFARTMKDAHVNAVTLFAKCHHGQCYYPTKSGVQHPALKGRDLLGEQIEALHRSGIACPIYTTVAWEEDVASRFPEWRQMRQDGTFSQIGNAADFSKRTPGGWKMLNFLHPGYQDYIEEHVRELFAAYDVDGIFFDILFFEGEAGWSETSVAFRKELGLMSDDRLTHQRFQVAAQDQFIRRFTKLVRGLSTDASIFYNGVGPHVRKEAGLAQFKDQLSHLELESLPSGFWGYFHFPRFARYATRTGMPWLGMTGRFQKMWGDFGGLKPQAALEYECFRAQAMGGASSVGDQLPPRGAPDRGAYDLIGAVYSQWAEAEPFYEKTSALPQVGIYLSQGDVEVEGAIQICDELHYDSVVLDETSSVEGLDLLILPDGTPATPLLQAAVKAHLDRGGKLLVSYRAGFTDDGDFSLPGVGLQFSPGDVLEYPTYLRARPEFDENLARSDRVIYEPGTILEPNQDGFQVLIDRVLPYFKRTDLKFCSHFQTPPMKDACPNPAAVSNGQVAYFADPIFSEYRRSGNLAARDAARTAIKQLIGEPPIGAELPTTVLSVPRRRDDDLILTLLHYVPLRKALEIDVCEEKMGFGGQVLRLDRAVKEVRVFGGAALKQLQPAQFELPVTSGRLLLEVPGYFAAAHLK